MALIEVEPFRASRCGRRHVWHLPKIRFAPPRGGMAGPKPDEACFCGKYQFRELAQGIPFANVYVDNDETVVAGPFLHTKGVYH